jgi:aldehyde:ferredoxin oxidoreductase
MPYGYTGKILQVDLSNQKIEVEEKDEAFYRSYLGGRGIGYHYLMQDVPAQTDPFSPENILVLATGVMTGAPLPAACRFTAVGKSPLTGTAGESEAAGFFGPELKMAGFDAIVFKGRAEKPVYLGVTEKKAEIKDATHLAEWGAREVEDAIRDEIGSKKVRVAQTGLAGMNRVRFANITNNLGHFNGRGGFGALMGSKNVRAVAALGSEKLEFHDPEFLRETAQHFAATFKNNPAGEALHVYGTTAFAEILSAAGALPVDNFRRSQLDDATSVSGDTYNEILLQKRRGCYACPIRCKRGIALDDPKYGVDSRYGGPEYETIAALGTNLNIADLKAIAKGNEICNRYCLDTISTGMTIAFACECFQEGIISKADTDGLELRFGDADLMIQLLELIARREGFGDLLAEGTTRLAKKWGVPYGADHMTAAHDNVFVDEKSFALKSVKPLGIYEPMPATEISAQKVRNYKILENFWRTLDALGLCVFGYAPRSVIPINTMVKCLNAITGWEASLFELMRAGERGTMIARAFNSREGFSANNDRLPQRLFDPKPDGANAGKHIFKEEDFNEAIRLYYDMMELGLEWIEASLNA